MSTHHHIARDNLIAFDELEKQFGGAGAAREFAGERYRRLLAEFAAIVEQQWRSGVARGLIKGFFLSGPPGTGKTTLAKRLAYELGLRFRDGAETAPVVLAFVDGAEVARSRYGESEERIRDLFAHTRAGFSAATQRSVVLFDDVESIFMARGSAHAKEWHFSQDSVFFHAVDDLDTSRSVLVLTTNRPDLVDDAIRDRFLAYRVDYPDRETILRVARNLAAEQRLSPAQSARLEARLGEAVAAGTVRSLRDAQRFLVQHHVGEVLGSPSLAETNSGLLA